MLAILFLLGLASIVTGVALWSVPAALVIGGSAVCVLALGLRRGELRTAPTAPQGGDS